MAIIAVPQTEGTLANSARLRSGTVAGLAIKGLFHRSNGPTAMADKGRGRLHPSMARARALAEGACTLPDPWQSMLYGGAPLPLSGPQVWQSFGYPAKLVARAGVEGTW